MGGLRWKLHLQRQRLTRKAVDTPWTDYSMPASSASTKSGQLDGAVDDGPQTTIAPFSPNQRTPRNGSASVLIHQKTPLLVGTPPQVTRALAYSHPFLLPLNHLAGLLSWTTGDPWESFLLVTAFWFVVLYGDDVIRWAGPVVVIVGLILGMYSRRYSPLSSTVWSGEKAKRKRADSEGRKSLDEIVETLQTFTARCEVLLDPFLRMTEFLSTQASATSATTRPALTTLFLRILAFTPIWILLTLPPLYILTPRRATLAIGTLGLTWHSRPARVSRTILWRSRSVRSIASFVTGLHFVGQVAGTASAPPLPPRKKGVPITTSDGKSPAPGVRFTFTLYENQRRWVGLGWTSSLLAYERQAWSDEHLNDAPDPDHFSLPDTDHGTATWRWAPDSEWRVEGATAGKEKSAKRIGGGGGSDDTGWIYYDNKWQGPSKTDGWGRYTRRRKWIRDAELVDEAPSDARNEDPENTATLTEMPSLDGSPLTSRQRKGWFGGNGPRKSARRLTNDQSDAVSKTGSGDTGATSSSSVRSRERDGPEDDLHTPLRFRQMDFDRSIGDGIAEGLS